MHKSKINQGVSHSAIEEKQPSTKAIRKDISHSIFEIEKKPMKVEEKGYSSELGSGGTRIVRWRIEELNPETFAWNIKKLDG